MFVSRVFLMLLGSVLNNFAPQYVKPVHFGMGFSDTSERFWNPIDFIIADFSFFREDWHLIVFWIQNLPEYMFLQRLKFLQDKVNRFQLLQVSLGLAFCVWIGTFYDQIPHFKPILLRRYLGTTPNASSLACLLYSICQQLSYTFMLPFEHIPNDIVPLTAHLKGC